MKNFLLNLSLGRLFFGLFFVCVFGVGTFYMGARFGPELIWGLKIDRDHPQPLIPVEATDEELVRLLKEGAEALPEVKQVYVAPLVKGDPEKIAAVPVEKPVEQPIEKQVEKQLEKPVEKPVEKPAEKAVQKTPEKGAQPVAAKEVKPEPAVVTPPVEVKAPTPAKGNYSLQVGSFANKEEAERVKAQYQAQGYAVTVKEVDFPQKGKWYRVYVGQYSSSQEAEAAKSKIAQAFHVMPQIIETKK